MAFTIAANKLFKDIAELHLSTDGDSHEQQYCVATNTYFPNYETFWRDIVVPMTRRIELPLGSQSRHEQREGIAQNLWRVSYLHYTAFQHLTYAYDHLALPLSSSFNDFYTHLGSVCDLAEDFLLAAYMTIQECREQPIRLMQQMTEAEFLEIAQDWYKKRYPTFYTHYLSKGKAAPIRLPQREMILGGYFGQKGEAWLGYQRLTGEIRKYRNRVVHDVAIGTILYGKFFLVPKKDVIDKYPDLNAVRLAMQDAKRLNKDFVVREEQMRGDLRDLQVQLNLLWEKPRADLRRLLRDRNPILLAKYDLMLT
jgi:hypothetical protein